MFTGVVLPTANPKTGYSTHIQNPRVFAFRTAVADPSICSPVSAAGACRYAKVGRYGVSASADVRGHRSGSAGRGGQNSSHLPGFAVVRNVGGAVGPPYNIPRMLIHGCLEASHNPPQLAPRASLGLDDDMPLIPSAPPVLSGAGAPEDKNAFA